MWSAVKIILAVAAIPLESAAAPPLVSDWWRDYAVHFLEGTKDNRRTDQYPWLRAFVDIVTSLHVSGAA
jgi:hypothetical protein